MTREKPEVQEASEQVEYRATSEAAVWEKSAYYDDAEKWTWLFWSEEHPFLPLFNLLDLDNTLELACGHGRHSEQLLMRHPDIKVLTLVDVLQSNVEFCQSRLKNYDQCRYLVNKGTTFSGVADSTVTAVFCYDAMVHFHRSVVLRYLFDMKRVLKKQGRALIHHSNYSVDPDDSFTTHPHARAFMSSNLFESYVYTAGLRLLGQRIIDWGGERKLDCISLIENAV